MMHEMDQVSLVYSGFWHLNMY